MNEEVEKGEADVFDRKVEREDVLVGKLLSRGLVVSDELQLRKIIRLVGYYRLTGYLYPFRQEVLAFGDVETYYCIARQMLNAVRPESKWADRLKSLLADYPEVPLAAMGFPADWQTLALWK